MLDSASLETLLRSVILALPLLVIAVLFFLLATSRRSGTDHAISDAVADRAPAHASAGGGAQPAGIGGTHNVAPPPPELPAEDPSEAHERAEVLEAEILAAEDAGETVLLAKLYMDLGRARLAADEEPLGLDAFRSAAGLAALYKAARIHADARIELAEAAIRHGDPTTACEHWQMARMAFLDAGDKPQGDRIDRRMRAQGCPTDWVLTDF